MPQELLLGGGAGAVVQAESADLRLAVEAGFQSGRGAVGGAYVHVFRGEERGRLAEHRLHEFVALLLAGADQFVEGSPSGSGLVGTAGAADSGAGRQRRHHVSCQADFGNHGDAALLCVADDLPYFVLGVEPSVALVVAGAVGRGRAFAPAADAVELGKRVGLHAPALVVAQMPDEAVELEGFHEVEAAAYLGGAPEMPGAVEHQPPVGHSGAVVNFAAGQHPSGFLPVRGPVDAFGQQLPEGLRGVDYPFVG